MGSLIRPSCGNASLGDVHARHQLEASENRGLIPLRKTLTDMADAIDPVSELDAILARLDVDVTRATSYRLDDEFVDQPDNFRVARIDVDRTVDRTVYGTVY